MHKYKDINGNIRTIDETVLIMLVNKCNSIANLAYILNASNEETEAMLKALYHNMTDKKEKPKREKKDYYAIESLSIKDSKKQAGYFRIRYNSNNQIKQYYYNLNEIRDNILPNNGIFDELFNTKEGYTNSKYDFTVIKKLQYVPKVQVKNISVAEAKRKANLIKICYLGEYIPQRTGLQDKYSRMILSLKNDERHAIDYFTKELEKWLNKNGLTNSGYILSCVPGHVASDHNISGVSSVITNLSYKYHYVDGRDLLLRTRTVEKKAGSTNRRSINVDIDTIKINSRFNIQNKIIILLDDVTTKGDSFKACAYHLYKNGAFMVITVAMGKTRSMR